MRRWNLKVFLTNWLRRGSYVTPMRNEAMKQARIGRGIYRCANCEGEFKRGDIQVDHIHPVIDPKVGFLNWDTYIERLYCEARLLQILCKPCHRIKTDEENRKRL